MMIAVIDGVAEGGAIRELTRGTPLSGGHFHQALRHDYPDLTPAYAFARQLQQDMIAEQALSVRTTADFGALKMLVAAIAPKKDWVAESAAFLEQRRARERDRLDEQISRLDFRIAQRKAASQTRMAKAAAKRMTIEQLDDVIDIRRLYEFGYLGADCEWRSISSGNWPTVDRLDCARYAIQLNRHGSNWPIWIPVSWTRPNCCGIRQPLMTCPSCQQRCQRLYGGLAGRYMCRACTNLPYKCQQGGKSLHSTPPKPNDRRGKHPRRRDPNTGHFLPGRVKSG